MRLHVSTRRSGLARGPSATRLCIMWLAPLAILRPRHSRRVELPLPLEDSYDNVASRREKPSWPMRSREEGCGPLPVFPRCDEFYTNPPPPLGPSLPKPRPTRRHRIGGEREKGGGVFVGWLVGWLVD